ncbi:MAG: hypothetical protein RIM72_19820 [Alphaproteobacteria bacterium]
MNTGIKRIAAAMVLLVFASACQTTGGGASGQAVLIKSRLTASVFDTDVEACETYVVTEGPSASEQGATMAASIVLAGIIGGIATASAYENSEKRLMRECMYGKGYRQVALPEEWQGQYSESQGPLPEYEATYELIEQGRLDVLLEYTDGSSKLVSVQPEAEPAAKSTQTAEPALVDDTAANTAGDVDQETQVWKIVENTTDPKDLNFYLAAYPDGKYAPLANRKLVGFRTVVAANSGFPFDGFWRVEIDLHATSQKPWDPDICKFSTKMPNYVELKDGNLDFVIGSGTPTIVTAVVSEDGQVSGQIDARGYTSNTSSFAFAAKTNSMSIPFTIDTACRGIIFLRRS